MPKKDTVRESGSLTPGQPLYNSQESYPSHPSGPNGSPRRGYEPSRTRGSRRPARRTPTQFATRAFSFGLVGGFVALVGFVLLYVLVQYVGLNKNLAYFIQAVVSIELNFFLNRSLTWRDRRGSGFGAFASVWARFHLTRVFTIALNQALFALFVFIGIHYLIANALCIIVVMVINFFVGDMFIFRSRPFATSLIEVSTADLVNPDMATEAHLTALLSPRTLPRTGWPTVSVVVPVGHNKHGTEATVAALLRQNYPGEIEIILVGDAKDPAWEAIRWYIDDELVTIVEAEPDASNTTLGMKRLAGVGRARGQVLASIDNGAVVPPTWVAQGVEYIQAGWPCIVGPTALFSQAGLPAQNAPTEPGRVLDPERFVEADYTPPIAANMFLAGDVLPVIISTKTQTGVNGEDFLEWLWNLAQADVAILETPTLRATLARSLSVRQLLAQYIGAGAALARFARAALDTTALPPQRLRLAAAFVAPIGLLALLISSIVAPDWPLELDLPQISGIVEPFGHAAVPAGWFITIVAIVCVLATVAIASISAVIRTGQRRAALTPLYRIAYFWSVIFTAFGAALHLPNRNAAMKFPAFSVIHAPDQAFTRPMPTMPPGSMRRRSMATPHGARPSSRASAVEWPSVSIVIPVKGNQATIGATIESLLRQDYSGPVEILLVGDVHDPTWAPIRPYISAGRVRILEVTIKTANRDSNAKRTIGLQNARGEILALTDSDMVLPSHWISTGVQYILRGWPCVGGPMRGATGSFWDAYADLVSLGSKTPRFVVNRVVDEKRFGLPHHKPPITANVFMTRDALKNAGDFDPTFIHSYEDYSWFWAAVKSGVPILCTPSLQADHYHRQGWNRLVRQYTRAGRGCADFIMKFPESPLSRKRVAQWLRVGATILGSLAVVVAGVVITLNAGALHVPTSLADANLLALPLDILDPLALVALLSAGLLGLGILNALTVRQARAVFFPFITLIFGLAFSYGMTVELATKLPGRLAQLASAHRTGALTAALYAGVLGLSAMLRLWSIGTRPGFEWDEPVYTSVGAHFAQFGIVEYKPPLGKSPIYLSHPPFYFMMLGEWFRIVGSGIAQARVLSVLMSLIMITVLFLYLRQRMGSAWALLPTTLVALDGWIVFANRISWIDNSVVVFGLLGIWAYFHALKRNTPRAFVIAGLALGFTLVFKQLGVYFCAIPALNWLLSRQRTRGHLVMLGSVVGCALLYLGFMTLKYGNLFWRQTLSQVFRSSGAVTSRGVVSSPQEILTALAGQYSIFAFTILLCGASLVWLGWDIFRSIRRRDASWLRQYSLEASWIIAGIGVFIAIQIKFPNYFIYLMVPLLAYFGMRVRDVVTGWLSADIRHPRMLRAGLLLALALAVGCDLGATYLRVGVRDDNALLQVSNYARSHIPTHDKVVADEPVGVMIPQRYCKLESPGQCQDAKWVITYTSITQKLPTRASDPQLYVLLDGAIPVVVFRGFKETITVYQVLAPGTSQGSSTPPVTPTPTVTTTVSPAATATATMAPVVNPPPAPTATARPTAVPTATPIPEPTATPTPTTP